MLGCGVIALMRLTAAVSRGRPGMVATSWGVVGEVMCASFRLMTVGSELRSSMVLGKARKIDPRASEGKN